MGLILDKAPPYSKEAEAAVLGAMILDTEAVLKVVEILPTPECFYRKDHAVIFEIVRGMVDRDVPVDVVSVAEELRKRSQLEAIGGGSFLAGLIDSISTAAHCEHYAGIVRELWVLRTLALAGVRMAQDAYAADAQADEILDAAERQVFALAQGAESTQTATLENDVHAIIDKIDNMGETRNAVTGLATGFAEFDKVTSGLQNGNLIVLAARPGMGKTSLALNFVENMCVRGGKPVLLFSLEMSRQELCWRLIAAHAGVDLWKLRTGFIKRNEMAGVVAAAEKVAAAPVYIEDRTDISALAMRSKARRLGARLAHSGQRLGMVVVDYMQLMSSGRSKESRQVEVADISRSLKALAREMDVPVLALSQLNRGPEDRTRDGRPHLADLRESGAIEQDADLVAFIYRPAFYQSGSDDEAKAKAKLIVAKHRNGPTAEVDLYFHRQMTKFVEMEREAN